MEAAKTKHDIDQFTAEIIGRKTDEQPHAEPDMFDFMGSQPVQMSAQAQAPAAVQKEQKDEFDLLFM